MRKFNNSIFFFNFIIRKKFSFGNGKKLAIYDDIKDAKGKCEEKDKLKKEQKNEKIFSDPGASTTVSKSEFIKSGESGQNDVKDKSNEEDKKVSEYPKKQENSDNNKNFDKSDKISEKKDSSDSYSIPKEKLFCSYRIDDYDENDFPKKDIGQVGQDRQPLEFDSGESTSEGGSSTIAQTKVPLGKKVSSEPGTDSNNKKMDDIKSAKH
jgi:hypothetical protein